MRIPKRTGHCNLVESIVEVRITPAADLPRALWAGLISQRVHDCGYDYVEVPGLNIVPESEKSLELQIDKNSSESSVLLFVNRKNGIRFIINGRDVSFNCEKGKYPGWDSYLESVTKILAALEDARITTAYTRAMVRYISEHPDIDILEHVKLDISTNADTTGYKPQDISLSRKTDNGNAYVMISGLRERISAKTDKHRFSSLFDVNVYGYPDGDTDCDGIVATLNHLHNLEKESFFGLLKDEFIATLDPEY